MLYTKTNVLPFLGLLIMAIITGYSYLYDSVFFDKILVCNFILFMVFFSKLKNENSLKQLDDNSLNRVVSKEQNS